MILPVRPGADLKAIEMGQLNAGYSRITSCPRAGGAEQANLGPLLVARQYTSPPHEAHLPGLVDSGHLAPRRRTQKDNKHLPFRSPVHF